MGPLLGLGEVMPGGRVLHGLQESISDGRDFGVHNKDESLGRADRAAFDWQRYLADR